MSLKKNFKNFSENLKKIPPALTFGAWLGFCIILTGGFFFLSRRLSGFFCRTMPTAGIFIFSIVFGITVLLLYFLIRAWSRGFPKKAVLLRRIMAVVLLLDYLLIGLAVQIPGTSLLTRLVFAAIFLLTAWTLYRFEFSRLLSPSEEPKQEPEQGLLPEADAVPVSDPESEFEEEADLESEEIEEEDASLPAGVSQKLERLQNPDGSEEISGLLRAEFLPNQTKVPLFVAFCPPFCQTPTVECFSLDGAAQVEIVQNAPHGVQLSVRKSPPAMLEDSVTLTFRAVSIRNS